MIINFNDIEEKAIPNMRGGEKIFYAKIFNDGKNKIMLSRLVPGASIGYHIHDTDCEMIYVLKGSGKLLTDSGEERISAGLCHYCPKGSSHGFINDGEEEIVFFAVVPQQ